MKNAKKKSAKELRYRAEQRLEKNKQDRTSTAKTAELQRLVHELEVHQIELEIQNEELQRARLELEASLRQYTDLYDFAPVGYFSLNRKGLILHANLTGALMLGLERSRMINQYFSRFVNTHNRSIFTSFLSTAFQSKSQETCVIELQKENGAACFAHFEARASQDQQKCRVALIDITAQKQAEEALRESESKYRTLFETMSQGVIQQGDDGRILSANPAAERILGLPMEQMQGKVWTDERWRTIHEDGSYFPEEKHPSMEALRTGKKVEDVVMGVFSQNTGGYIWLNVHAVPQFISGECKPFQVFITFEDISIRKRMVVYNKLTTREKETFKLLAKGRSRKIIAETLNISPKTVDKHRENLMEKLNLYTIDGVVKFASSIGLVEI